MKHRTYIAVVAFIALCLGAFLAPLFLPEAEAQRGGYVEKRAGGSALANQLSPDPITGMCLQADINNQTVWGPCGSLPSGYPGQIAGIVESTDTVTMTLIETSSVTGTHIETHTATIYGTGVNSATHTDIVIGTSTATKTDTVSVTGTGTLTQTYVFTATYTITGTTTATPPYTTWDEGTRTATGTLTLTQTTTNTGTITQTEYGTGTYSFSETNTQVGTETWTQTYTYPVTSTASGTGTGIEWKAVNGTIYAGSNVTLSKGTSTVTDTSVTMAENPTIHSVSSNVPGGDLFMYAYTDYNQIAFAASPEPAMDVDSYVTATTSPTYFLLSEQNENISVVNHFEDTTSQKVWISRGSIFYSFPLKASAPVTTHAVFGICTKVALVETLESTIQDVSFSVTSSDWSVFTGAIALPNGLLIPAEHRLCLRIYSQTTSGSATSYLGTSYAHQTWLNGPWIKSGANAWAP